MKTFESLRKSISQMSSKYPEGSTVMYKGKKAKVLTVYKDGLRIAIGNKNINVKPSDVDEQIARIAKKVTGINAAKALAAKIEKAKKKAMDVITLKNLRDRLASLKPKGGKVTAAMKGMMETKITWKNNVINDGTMGIGIFDSDRDKALDAAKQLIIFLRKNKRTKIGGEKEDSAGEPNEAIAKYTEELSKLFFDDKLLDDLEPNGNNADQDANDLVIKRLRDLGVNIK